MSKTDIHMFGNGHRENIVFTVNAGISVKCHFKVSGNDTATNKYFNLDQFAKKIHIIPSIAASMTKINNQTLKSPRTLSVAGNVFREGIEWGTLTVRADSNSTTFEIYAS